MVGKKDYVYVLFEIIILILIIGFVSPVTSLV